MTPAYSTVEALMYQLRSGANALADINAQCRLSELDDQQLREVMVRLQKFKPEIALAWTPEQVEILVAVRSKLS